MAPVESADMKIWHQSFTDLDAFPLYRDTLRRHAARVMGGDATVVVHGLKPGTYPEGVAPMEANSHAPLRMLQARQVCDAVKVAEREGYDAFALGCFFDPALAEARSLVDIPVVSLAETCMLTACSLGRKFALVSLTDFQKMLTEDLARAYGLESRMAGVVAMAPGVRLFDLEDEAAAASIEERFVESCRQALALGAEVIIPGDGVLNEFLVRRKVLSVEGASVIDALGVLFQHAAFFAKARESGSAAISRRLLYKRPTDGMLQHAQRTAATPASSEADFSGSNHVRRP
jgi:allantoin racemase